MIRGDYFYGIWRFSVYSFRSTELSRLGEGKEGKIRDAGWKFESNRVKRPKWVFHELYLTPYRYRFTTDRQTALFLNFDFHPEHNPFKAP